MTTISIDELLGSRRGAAKRGCGSRITRLIKSLFRKLSRQERKLQVVNQTSYEVNLILLECTLEEIQSMIMDNHGTINSK